MQGGANAYAYAPNPVQWVDPFGLRKRLGCRGKFHSFHDVDLPDDKLFASDGVQFRIANNNGTRTTVEGGELDNPVVGFSAKAGGAGIQHPVVQDLYDSVPENQRSLTHGYCGEADTLSQVAQHNNVQSADDLKEIVQGEKSTTVINDGKHLAFHPSCAHVMGRLGVCDGA